jgi:hypothetical protein
VDEAGELVAREQGALEIRVARHLEVLGMREHRLDQLLGIALLTKDRGAVLRMLVQRRMDLVVEVVEERRRAPELLVAVHSPCIRADGGLHGERVPEQRLALRVAG